MLVIPEALSLTALIFGFHAIIEWLIELGNKAMSALEHCAQLIIDITKMREWVKNIRQTYRITAVMGEGVFGHLKSELHGALDDILRACNEVQSLTDRIERSHWQTWRALVNKSKIKKMVEELNQKKQNLNQLETKMLFAQYLEEQKIKREKEARYEAKRKARREKAAAARYLEEEKEEKRNREEAKRKAKAEKKRRREKAAADADASRDCPPPPYQTSKYDQVYTDSGAKPGTMVIADAGIGGFTTLCAVTLLALVTGVAAVAGATVYHLVAIGSLGHGATGWAKS
ncbi:hypothetical protein F5882DRAFT_520376 [Hyaloscypha sp. PMI_1271]|nr:hypothetical protein F5882DRAFT_520376 [Hyaloscypha sp. PMI_1271]